MSERSRRREFDQYVKSCEMVNARCCPFREMNGYASEISIRLEMEDVCSRGYTDIVAGLVSDGKGLLMQKRPDDTEPSYVLLSPYYQKARSDVMRRPKNLDIKNLQKAVRTKQFTELLEKSLLWYVSPGVIAGLPKGAKEGMTFYKLPMDLIKQHGCLSVINKLMEKRFAFPYKRVDEPEGAVEYILLYADLEKRMYQERELDSNLSSFRKILNETNNVECMIKLLAKGEQDKEDAKSILIDMDTIRDYRMGLDILVLIDAGVGRLVERENTEFFSVKTAYANWLFSHIGDVNTNLALLECFEGVIE